jgi:hypothetical protein
MKKILFVVVLIMALSCNNNKTTNEKNNGTADSTPKAIDSKNLPKDLNTIKAGLETLVPFSEEQMKALFPQQLLGHDKSETDLTTSMGAMAANTEYRISDISTVTVLIVDCAGPGGSGFFSMHYLDNSKEKMDTENYVVNVSERNGQKAFENCPKDSATFLNCMYYYFAGNRFLVTISGENTGIELLKNAASEIKLNSN